MAAEFLSLLSRRKAANPTSIVYGWPDQEAGPGACSTAAHKATEERLHSTGGLPGCLK